MLTNATEVFQYFDKYLKFLTEEKKLKRSFGKVQKPKRIDGQQSSSEALL